VPTGLIQDYDGMCARADDGGDLVKVQLHGFGVTGREDECGARATLRAYRTEYVGRLGSLVLRRARARAFLGPSICQFVLLANPHLILEPNLYRGSRGKPGADIRYLQPKLFLNASMAAGSCL